MDSDPWRWSISDVQQFFRQDAARYVRDRNSYLPPMPTFLQSLADNEVDGASLLDAVESTTLRDDLGIRSLRDRGAIMHCIYKLRSVSLSYRGRGLSEAPGTPASLPGAPSFSDAAVLPPADAQLLMDFDQDMPVGHHVRENEVEVQDTRGRKRRKLDLTKSMLAPSKLELDHTSHLPDAALPVDEIFFGSTTLGHEVLTVPPAGNIMVHTLESTGETKEFHFSRPATQHPGEAEYVSRRLTYLFNQVTDERGINLQRFGQDAVAFLPYPDQYHKSKARSALVIQAGSTDNFVATREKADLLRTDYQYGGGEQESTGEWDFLVDKYKQGSEDQELPVLGQSEAELKITATNSSINEDEEAHEDADTYAAVKANQSSTLVEDYMTAYAAQWREKKTGQWEGKAWTVWRQMKQSRTLRDIMIEAAKTEIKRLGLRLTNLTRDIVGEEWSSSAALKSECARLDPTLEDREYEMWKISVWQRKKEPEHVIHHRHASSGHAQQTLATTKSTNNSFVLHQGDRLSISPTRATHVVAPPTISKEATPAGHHTDEEAEVEDFHTPSGSPFVEPSQLPEDGFEASDEMSALDPSSPDFIQRLSEAETPVAIAGSARSSQPVTTRTSTRGSVERSATKHLDSTMQGQTSADELPSPSTFVSQRVKPELATPSKDRFDGRGHLSSQPIELLSDSGPTPRSRRKKGLPNKTVAKKTEPKYDGNGEFAVAPDVDAWEYDELHARSDRMRLLIKVLKDNGADMRNDLHRSFMRDRAAFNKELQAIVKAQGQASSLLRFDDIMLWCARVLAVWYRCDIAYLSRDPEAELWSEIIRDKEQIERFVQMLATVLRKIKSVLFEMPQRTETSAAPRAPSTMHLASDSEEGPKDTPHKRRKRKMLESQAVKKTRTDAHARQEKFDRVMETQAQGSSQLASLDPTDSVKTEIVFNLAQVAEGKQPIYIHASLARMMKDHQIKGVRFLWREITAKGDDDGPQGCLLAHTMGLGKTMQTIALLVAVVETCESRDKGIRKQLPRTLIPKAARDERTLRILILCPPTLVENWYREIQKWAPLNKLGHIHRIEASGTAGGNMEILEEWYQIGGVLLIGYAMFRGFTHRNTERRQKQDGEMLDKILLQGPELVVADEAHNMKNPRAGVSLGPSAIKTQSRIALTGTPMSNDVDEIYALISWVAPDFLGEPQWFRAQYGEPIKDGLYEDSSAYERRKSIKKLAVLHRDIGPKVDRADITALKGSLQSKVEYVITIEMTHTQRTLYSRCVHALLTGDRNRSASQVTIFSWLGLLMLLTNHPAAFQRKLLQPKPTQARKSKKDPVELLREDSPAVSDASAGTMATSALEDATLEQVMEAEAMGDPGEEDLFTLGFTQKMIDTIVAGFEQDIDPKLSPKMESLLEIVNSSRLCDDKLLIFSGSIPTINYVCDLFNDRSVRYGRIDGQIASAKRMSAIKNLDEGMFDVLIVSTRAGGVGLNIQSANRVVILDFSFNPTWEEQAIGRAYRLGQTKPVFVYRFVAGGTFETNIYNKQQFKTSLAQRVVDKKNPRRNATKNTREYLYEPTPVQQDDVGDLIGKDPLVLDKLLIRQSQGKDLHIRSVQTMETLQADAGDEPLNAEEQKEVDEELKQGRLKDRARLQLQAAYPSTATPVGGPAYGGMGPPSTTQPLRPTLPVTPSTSHQQPIFNGTASSFATRPPSATSMPSALSTTPNGHIPQNFKPLYPPGSRTM
ncbi:hypothetical protein LTR78_003613 [Recurvomyces mirabilis]|uniref:Uncharacterized protein n=1 Tax=Recurvomyces mirabilis TaxID=574656 RepID=A0AAE0WRJ9_9PEZI|nr:hypothetical protein LTR78_003613 [Recurvomyces mirabilis]KAK5154728.1 hypothetical protein LTS14_006307 [Recurvomyces mirabilis]